MNNFKTYFTEATKKDILAGLDKVAEQPTAYGLIEVYLSTGGVDVNPTVVVFGDETSKVSFQPYSSQPILLGTDAIRVGKYAYIKKEDIEKFSRMEDGAPVYITNKQWLDYLASAGHPSDEWLDNVQTVNFLEELFRNLRRFIRVNEV